MDIQFMIATNGVAILRCQGLPAKPVNAVYMGEEPFLALGFEGAEEKFVMDCPLDQVAYDYLATQKFFLIGYYNKTSVITSQVVPLHRSTESFC